MRSKIGSFFRSYWILILIVAVKFILQYTLVNPYYELHRDEFLHLDQADHIAFGFISLPPLTSVLSKLILLLGGGEFWVRFFPALTGALTIIVAWLIVEELNGGLWSKLLVSFALLFSVLIRLNMLFQPNSIDILVWILIFWALVKYINSDQDKWLYYLALIIAVGVYNKYNVVFILAATAFGLILTPARRLFTRSGFWKASALLVILILPNIIWQVVHDFPVIDHMRVLKNNQLDNNSAAGFLESQLRFFIGSLPLTIAGVTALLFYKPFRPYKFIGLSYIVLITLYAVLKAKDYYSIGIYPVIFTFAGVFFEKALKSAWRISLITVMMIFNLLVAAAVLRFLMPVMSPHEIIENREYFEKYGMLRWEDGQNHQLPQDFADMTGWKEMADKALEAYKMIPEKELRSTLVFCDNYGETGALNYYNRGKMKEAYSFNTDYIYWLPRIDTIKNVILIGERTEERIESMFSNFQQIGSVENEYAREKGTGIFLYTGADPAFTVFFYGLAERRKKELDIF